MRNPTSIFLTLLVLTLSWGCTNKEKETDLTTDWAWMYLRGDHSDTEWEKDFTMMKEVGIDGILMLLRDNDMEQFEKVMRIGKTAGLSMHVWIPTTNPHGKGNLKGAHPDWFMVSREGISCIDKPPYIPSYLWLCPNHDEAKEFIINQMTELARMDYLDGVHLDYIRYPDVILPVGIQPKYNLVQDHEFPEFDFCYCDVCREKFKALEGIDPVELEDPASNKAWLEFRYNTITELVNDIALIVHSEGKQLTAAVFPTPAIARKLVRQDWPKWNLDVVMPMIYHEYYDEPLNWIQEATRQGVEAIDGKMTYASGVFVGWIKPSEMQQMVDNALAGGANGICLFNANMMDRRQWKALDKALH